MTLNYTDNDILNLQLKYKDDNDVLALINAFLDERQKLIEHQNESAIIASEDGR